MKLLSIVKSWDFLGPEIKFRINQQENFKTIFGGMISILYYIAFITFFSLFGGDFFFKQNPKIITQALSDKVPNKTIELSNDNFYFAFRFTDFFSKTIELNTDSELFDFMHQYFTEKSFFEKKFLFKNCSEPIFKIFESKQKKEFMCVDFSALKNKTIGGYFDTLDVFTAVLVFNLNIQENLFKYKTGENKTQKFQEMIKAGMFVNIQLPLPTFDPNNYENPLRLENKNLFALLSKNSFVLDQVFLSDYVVETDSGILFDSVNSAKMTGVGNVRQLFSLLNSDKYIAYYSMEISYEKTFYQMTRQYTKFQDLLGNINGFMEMVMFLFSLLISFNSDYRLNKYIANKLIYIVDSDVYEKADFRIKHNKFENPTKNKNKSAYNNHDFTNKKKDFESYNKEYIKVNIDKLPIKEESSNNQSKIELENYSDVLSKSERKDLIMNHSSQVFNNANKLSPKENKEDIYNEESLKLRIKLCHEIHKRKITNDRILEYSFLDHFCKSKICKYKKNFDHSKSNREIAEDVTEKAFKKFDILFYLRFANEFENIKKLYLDEFQTKVLEDVSKRIYFYKLFRNKETLEKIKNKKKNKNIELVNKHFVDKCKSDQLDKTDKRLFELFDGII